MSQLFRPAQRARCFTRSFDLVAWILLATALLSAPAFATEPAPFDAGRAGFAVRVRGEVNPYRVLAVSVLPAETLMIEVVGSSPPGAFELVRESGRVSSGEGRRFTWTAPREPGLRRLEVRHVDRDLRMALHVLVLVPASEARDGHLNGYRMGHYPATPLRGLAVYRPPRGFIEVTEDLLDLEVSPHFRLGQFLCKQEGNRHNGGWPRYLLLREKLLLKLEYLLQTVNAKGYRASTFAVLSGFRTPWYNHAIGNVKYSRHQWGGAADIFLDEDGDGVMDDLDGNGRIDGRDADLLYDLIDGLGSREDYATQFTGGLGKYPPNPVRGPFVHVDARGYRARWGR